MLPHSNGAKAQWVDPALHRLNGISTFDTYSLLRVDDLMDRLEKAWFISMLDLTKGYWKVVFTLEAKEKTERITCTILDRYSANCGKQGSW